MLFSRGAYIKIGRFEKIAVGDTEVEVLKYKDVIDGPLIMQADMAMECLYTKYFKGIISFDGLQRIENYMLPKGVVRELLMNAIMHKDYAINAPITISVFDDRISVHNVGEWPADLPHDERLFAFHASHPHNRTLAQMFFNAGDVENWGAGFSNIKRECASSSTPLPTISVGTSDIVVTALCSTVYRSLEADAKATSETADVLASGSDPSISPIPRDVYVTLKEFSSRNSIALEVLCKVYSYLQEPRSRKQILESNISDGMSVWAFWGSVIKPLIRDGLVRYTHPDKLQSSRQRYLWSGR